MALRVSCWSYVPAYLQVICLNNFSNSILQVRQQPKSTVHSRFQASRAPASTVFLRSTRDSRAVTPMQAATVTKEVWVQTTDEAVFTTALENGFRSFLFDRDREALAQEWCSTAHINPLFSDSGVVWTQTGDWVASIFELASPSDLKEFTAEIVEAAAVFEAAATNKVAGEKLAPQQGLVFVMDATDWRIIPAENLVAACQGKPVKLLAKVTTATDSRVMLEALEVGTDGVVLVTGDPNQVRELGQYLRQRGVAVGDTLEYNADDMVLAKPGGEGDMQGTGQASNTLARAEPDGVGAMQGSAAASIKLEYESCAVTRVEPVGLGDRVCVDLACLMVPGEGLLVGSFARALFLVHSECAESQYINSRPFRVNAGPVHAYVAAEGGKTAYLSELGSGARVTVADAHGRCRSALVGRCKVETRPMVLVEVQSSHGQLHSTLLQNAETVKLIGPAFPPPDPATSGLVSQDNTLLQPPSAAGTTQTQQQRWQATSVCNLKPRDQVYVLRQAGARHTGIAIDEFILEK